MPHSQQDAEAALQKLGQRIRAGHAKQHPISERSLETVRTAVREDWERDKAALPAKSPKPSKSRDRKPNEPGIEP